MAPLPLRSYKNAAVLPPETRVSIYVDVPQLLVNHTFHNNVKTRTLSEDYILRCFGQANYLSGVPMNQQEWERYLMYANYEEALGTFVYEDMTLREMASPENRSYKKLEANLKWIANQLQAHISVFVGHIETCSEYVDDVYKKAVEEIKLYSSLPTIFIIIACRGDDLAFRLNTESQYNIFRQHKIVFFGFQDLLHIHEGELYSTKLFDTARSKAICDSEEMVELFKSLDTALDTAGVEAKMPLNPQQVLGIYRHNPELEIFKCCKAKLGRLYSDFVKGLERRQTTKYTKEHLYIKFYQFIQDIRTPLTSKLTTITSADGIDCDKKPCDIPNLYEAEEQLSQEYNRKGAFHSLFAELKAYIYPAYIYGNKQYNSKDDYEKGVEQFFKRIQGLKGKDMSVFTYSPNLVEIIPILFELFSETFESPKHPLFETTRFIFTKYSGSLDFNVKAPITEDSILHEIIKSKTLSENQIYILFKTIYDVLPSQTVRETVFFMKNKEGNIPIAKKPVPLIVLFYIEKFGTKLKDVSYTVKKKKGNLLHAILENSISYDPKEKDLLLLECVKGLLHSGVDPNKRLEVEEFTYAGYSGGQLYVTVPTVKPLELYAKLYLPPYNTTLFTYFLRYGMTNDTMFFTKQKEFFEEISQSVEKRTSFMRVIDALRHFLLEFEGDYTNFNQSGGMPLYRPYRYYNNNNNNYSDYSPNRSYNSNYREERITRFLSENEYAQYQERKKTYIDYDDKWHQVQKNLEDFMVSPAAKAATETVKLMTTLLSMRKGMKKHGSKVRRTYKFNKQNFNKTIKNKFNSIQWNMNGEKMIGDYLGKILELAKRPEFTKEEKANYKKRPLAISKSANLQPREKYNSLKKIYEQMEEALKTR